MCPLLPAAQQDGSLLQPPPKLSLPADAIGLAACCVVLAWLLPADASCQQPDRWSPSPVAPWSAGLDCCSAWLLVALCQGSFSASKRKRMCTVRAVRFLGVNGLRTIVVVVNLFRESIVINRGIVDSRPPPPTPDTRPTHLIPFATPPSLDYFFLFAFMETARSLQPAR